MKSYKDSLLLVSRAAIRLPEVPGTAGRADDEPAVAPPEAGTQEEENVRTYDESAGSPKVSAKEDLPPEVIGVPQRAFQWS